MTKTKTSTIIEELQEKKQEKIRKSKKSQRIVFIFALLLILFLFTALDDKANMIIFTIFIMIFTGIVIYLFRASANTIHKINLFTELVKSLEHEIYPNSKVQYDLDLTTIDDPSKRTWEGRSAHGNYKAKYTDYWLRLRCTLLDRSRLQITKQTKYKMRKGACIKKKMYLCIKFTPNLNLYSFKLDEDILFLQNMVQKKLEDGFPEDTLEGWASDLSKEGQTHFKIKILQQERPYTMEDISKVLIGMYALLDRRLLPSETPQ